MSWRKPHTTFISFCLVFLVGLLLSGLPMQVLAQQSNPQVQGRWVTSQPLAGLAPGILQAIAPPPKPNAGNRQPGGGRGCGREMPKPPLTALIPESTFGTTVESYPKFLSFIPQTSETTARFVLTDEEKQVRVYEKMFTIPSSPGIVKLNLPTDKTLPPLEVGKYYRWNLSIICVFQDRSADIYVEGLVQRVEPSSTLTSQLEKASPHKRVDIYKDNDLWYDALATLAEQRGLKPEDAAIQAEWENLLRSQGLSEISQTPLRAVFISPK
ncbi:MAG: DUF928 domain-containing protein [Coleofasciculus sp. Co-bin14]|nr:DUF928 domain-containing protein [Coleofasciculus sp. Co-bin14]